MGFYLNIAHCIGAALAVAGWRLAAGSGAQPIEHAGRRSPLADPGKRVNVV